MFGNNKGGLFGNNNNNNLFGNQTQSNNGGLFGTNQNQQNTGSFFGANQNQQKTGGGLFDANNNNNNNNNNLNNQNIIPNTNFFTTVTPVITLNQGNDIRNVQLCKSDFPRQCITIEIKFKKSRN